MSSALHADALLTLREWTPPATTSPRERAAQAALCERFLSHLEATPHGMWRSAFPEHLTAGTLVVDASGDRVLLNLHRKAGRWFAFGGHCEEGDATLAAAARREAHEESGLSALEFSPAPLQLDVHPVTFCDPRGTVHHLDVRYGARTQGAQTERASDESLAVRWWPIGDLPDLEPSMLRLIDWTRDTLC